MGDTATQERPLPTEKGQVPLVLPDTMHITCQEVQLWVFCTTSYNLLSLQSERWLRALEWSWGW